MESAFANDFGFGDVNMNIKGAVNWEKGELHEVIWKIPSTVECLEISEFQKWLTIDLSEVMNMVYLKVNS